MDPNNFFKSRRSHERNEIFNSTDQKSTLASAKDTPEGGRKTKRTASANDKENLAVSSDAFKSPKVDKKRANIKPLTERLGPNYSTLPYAAVSGSTKKENKVEGPNQNFDNDVSMPTLPSFEPNDVNMIRESYEANYQNDTTSSDGIHFAPSSSQDDQMEGQINHDVNSETDSSQTSSQSENVSKTFVSTFDFIEKIGKGGFGRVFKARHKASDTFCAIKIVRYNQNCVREVQALYKLNHVNVVRCFNCWEEASRYDSDSSSESGSSSGSPYSFPAKYLYIQMELCDGKTVKDWINEKNAKNSVRVSKRRKLSHKIILEIVSGVEYIHSKKFIHRDLKPANIMIDSNNEVKIGDFGLVTADDNDDTDNAMKRTTGKGTPSYMAPEQRSNTYNRKVDIFAVGLIYFELLWKFSSYHERAVIWEDVRGQKLPKEFKNGFFEEYMILSPTLSAEPDNRPEASLLKTDLEAYSRKTEIQQSTASQ